MKILASKQHCRLHPYERLIICDNCNSEECPCWNFCQWCGKYMGDFDARCVASWGETQSN